MVITFKQEASFGQRFDRDAWKNNIGKIATVTIEYNKYDARITSANVVENGKAVEITVHLTKQEPRVKLEKLK